jgi:hypothetical protein
VRTDGARSYQQYPLSPRKIHALRVEVDEGERLTDDGEEEEEKDEKEGGGLVGCYGWVTEGALIAPR